MLIHLDLESGIGGFALAAEWAGFTTICFVEIDEYCQMVLRKHWPDVPIVSNVRNVEEIKRIVSGKPITLITAGVPCQPSSLAGKRRGQHDDRWLWPETFAVVREVKPKWCLFENVPGILALEKGMVFHNLLSELEGLGYEVETYIIPACAVNAPHRRDRVWIVAHHSNDGRSRSRLSISKRRPKQKDPDSSGKGENVPDTECQGQPNDKRRGTHEILEWQAVPDRNSREIRTNEYWCAEPELGRVAHGIPNRVDRLKCLGNAIVPQVAYQILRLIAEIES